MLPLLARAHCQALPCCLMPAALLPCCLLTCSVMVPAVPAVTQRALSQVPVASLVNQRAYQRELAAALLAKWVADMEVGGRAGLLVAGPASGRLVQRAGWAVAREKGPKCWPCIGSQAASRGMLSGLRKMPGHSCDDSWRIEPQEWVALCHAGSSKYIPSQRAGHRAGWRQT